MSFIASNNDVDNTGGSEVVLKSPTGTDLLGQLTMAASLPVVIASNQSAIPISAASLPLPTGAATAALQTQPGVDIGDVTINNASGAAAVNIQDGGNTITVDGTVTTTQGTSPWVISAASLPLPTGAATSALQTTGNSSLSSIDTKTLAAGQALMAASSPVVIASNQSAIPVTGTFFQATQPVSGTVTSNIGTTGGLALDATLTGGTQKAIVRGGAKGSTTAADVTSTASGANHQTLDVAIYDAAGNQITTFGGGQQYADGSARGTATGTLAMGDDGTNIQSISVDSTGKLNINSISSTVNASLGNTTGKTNVLTTGSVVTTTTTANQVVLTYTVTALKTFYLEYVTFQAYRTTLPGNVNPLLLGTISLETPSGTKVITFDLFHMMINPNVVQFTEPIPIAAGVVVRVVVTPSAVTSTTWRANFGGYEK